MQSGGIGAKGGLHKLPSILLHKKKTYNNKLMQSLHAFGLRKKNEYKTKVF